tara:strand:- start:731 stop:1168 length:438 start_codon:yes stop_codon:yes gene_type:complete
MFRNILKKFVIIIITSVTTSSFAADIKVEMLNKRADGQIMVYSEDISKIDVGDTITWVPTTKGHNVEFLAGPNGWEIPKKSQMNKEYSYTFEIPGIYFYQCTPHKVMGMIALVVVGGDTSNKDSIAKVKVFAKAKKKLPELLGQL